MIFYNNTFFVKVYVFMHLGFYELCVYVFKKHYQHIFFHYYISFCTQVKDFLRAGRGIYEDLCRRLPLYPSDFTDGESLFLSRLKIREVSLLLRLRCLLLCGFSLQVFWTLTDLCWSTPPQPSSSTSPSCCRPLRSALWMTRAHEER